MCWAKAKKEDKEKRKEKRVTEGREEKEWENNVKGEEGRGVRLAVERWAYFPWNIVVSKLSHARELIDSTERFEISTSQSTSPVINNLPSKKCQ